MIGDILPPDHFSIAVEKITRYLLDLTHAEGGSKAMFFLSFGFDPADPETFAEALADHGNMAAVQKIRTTSWGVKFIFEGPLVTPDGRNPVVRSVWQTGRGGGGTALLVTAYPAQIEA